MQLSTRRTALKSGLLLVGGALGVRAATDARADSLLNGHHLTLYATGLQATVANLIVGQLPSQGDQAVLNATLLDGPTGNVVGSLAGTAAFTSSPLGSSDSPTGAVETHVFTLPDGTIIGAGALAADFSGGTFVILGGTGAYARSHGTYTAVENHIELGGDGTAAYTFLLTKEN